MNPDRIKIIFFSIALLGLFLLYQNGLLGYLDKEFLQSTIETYPSYAAILFILFYALITIIFIPVGPFVILAGAIFGSIYGMIYVFIGAVIGGIISLVISRFFLYSYFTKLFEERYQQLKHYQICIEENKQGALFWLRLTPIIPSNILNYTCGLTHVSLKTFIWTFLGVLPGTFFYTYLGESLTGLMLSNVVILILLTILMLALTYSVRKYLPQKE